MPEGFGRIERGRLQDWQELLGRKVSIRYRIHDDPESALSEAIGVVMSVTPRDDGHQDLAIVTKKGDIRKLAAVDVLAGKVWPLA